jgi:hypothetical protein
MTTLSAKNFQGPLLRTLGKLTGFQAGVVVQAEDTYPGILAIMNIADLDAHGTNDSSGQPQIVKWIQWANVNTRKAGQTENSGRGKWGLTDEGVAEALRLAKQAGDDTMAKPTLAAKVAAVPKPVSKATLKLALPMSDASHYHEDAYIRKLAIDLTGCFGKNSPHGASVCPDCPLRQECRNRQVGEFAKLAKRLQAEDQKGKAPKATPAATPAAAPAPGGTRFPNFDFSDIDIIKNKAEAVCAECGKAIAKNERCRWVEELPDSDDGGLFHLDCSGGGS